MYPSAYGHIVPSGLVMLGIKPLVQYMHWRAELPMRLYMGLHPIHHRSVNLISMSQFGIMSKMPFLRTRGSWEDS
jgi:hypothetical protein